MLDVLRDLRLGKRLLLKSPGYSLVVVFTLALAIGANTIIFSFADLFLLRPLPIGDSTRVLMLYSVDTARGVQRGRTSLPDFLDWRADSTTFEQIGAYTRAGYTLTGSGDPLRVTAFRSTANLLSMWQLRTVAGRGFLSGEDVPGAPAVALLSHRFWKEHFASDPGVIGRSITLNGEPRTVVGVVTEEIEIGSNAEIDVWVPLTLDRAGARRDDRTLSVSARLKPGKTLDQASADIRKVAHQLELAYPATNAGWSARALTVRESIGGQNAWIVLLMLVIVVGFVLLIACANVANMMLARATAREKEIAIRLALGATRRQLASQLVSESILLGLLGGVIGLAIAYAGLRVIQAASNEPFFRLLSINGRVLAFTATLSILASLVFSLLPALQASRRDVNEALKDAGRRTAGSARGHRSRAALVVSQLSLALALLVVTGLITRSIEAEEHTPTGIDPSRVLSFRVELDAPKYRDARSATTFASQLSERLRALPSVRGTATASALPLIDGEPAVRFQVSGARIAAANELPWANLVAVGGDYLDVFRIRLLAGRALSARDDASAPAVVMISVAAARRYWGDRSPIGSRIELVGREDEQRSAEVVGVVDDVKTSELTEPMPPRIYRAIAQSPERGVVFALRTDGDPAALAPAVRETIRAADPTLALSRIVPLSAALRDTFQENRVLIGMFGAFALVALLLSGAGLYGVTAYAVSQRMQEIGIRMALGATAADVVRMVIGQSARLVAAAAVVGGIGGAALGSAMRRVLYNVGPTDPVTFATVLALLATITFLATILPARRATGVDPLECLRIE